MMIENELYMAYNMQLRLALNASLNCILYAIYILYAYYMHIICILYAYCTSLPCKAGVSCLNCMLLQLYAVMRQVYAVVIAVAVVAILNYHLQLYLQLSLA